MVREQKVSFSWQSVDVQKSKSGWIHPPIFPTIFLCFPPFFSFLFSPLSSSFSLLSPSNSSFSSFLFCSPLLFSLLSALMWEPDEALIVSTGSQHLPHLMQTGRSLLLSVPLRAFLSFPLCSSLLPPSPMASSAESPQRSIVCPYEPC